jgi:hypothetical protein
MFVSLRLLYYFAVDARWGMGGFYKEKLGVLLSDSFFWNKILLGVVIEPSMFVLFKS